MNRIKLRTQFAPAERATDEKVKSQIRLLRDFSLLQRLYDAVTEAVFIINKERQIVFLNQSFAKFVKMNSSSLFGLRMGEAFNCIYSRINPAGCGTSPFCSACGAARAILKGLNNKISLQECRIIKYDSGNAFDFLVQSTPFNLKDEKFVIVTVRDISDEKRRQFLEKIFFHDILNTISRLQLNVELLQKTNGKSLEHIKNNLMSEVSKLTEEINTQKILIAAEKSELVINLSMAETELIINDLIRQYNSFAKAKRIKIQKQSVKNVAFMTDQTLLHRVLGNMIKNAIEASRKADIVKIKCKAQKNKIHFAIHNPAVMAKDVQLQVFQRSFSTKGAGRGLGTYSMKLLTERYLKGSVSFKSIKGKGTTFIASHPIE